MASRYDLICNVNGGSEHKIWRIKVRVIRLWRSSYFKDNNNKPMIELVVLDEQGGRIQCTVKSIHVYLFENSINEGNVYMLENLSVALNSGKYKPTMQFRMFFKRETRVTLVEDSSIPLYGFSFVPFVEILNETKDDRRLVDVLGVVTGKGNLVEFKKEGKPCNYVVIELENIEGGLKLRFTLWEDYAFMFLKHLEDHPSESYVVVLQFAKMKNFKGSVGVSNTTYNSKLFINANIPEIEDFQMRVKSSDSQQGIQFSQLSDHASLTLEEEFLERGVYKSIADLKEVTQNSVFVTIGTVKDIESEYNWCYRAYSASFILFDKEASNFLKILAYELRTSYIAKGGDKNRHPEEIDSFKDKKFLFKVQVKIQDMESIVPYVISISRLCFEDNIIASFEKKYQIEEVVLIQDNSELLSQFTESSDLLKILQVPFYRLEKTASNMDSSVIKVLDVDLAEYCGNASFDTPSKCKGEMHSEQTIVRVAVHGDEQSAKKLRKVIKEEKN
ncbi:Nucleic acid-binding, OB-fold [Sesbania bispinosa]|nr:Nucleic acid-binding, OB-fold [Sesbania bispinosa]